jgi:hypothetical protein
VNRSLLDRVGGGGRIRTSVGEIMASRVTTSAPFDRSGTPPEGTSLHHISATAKRIGWTGARWTSENAPPRHFVNTLYWLSLTLGWGSAQTRYACRTGHALCPSLAKTLSARGRRATPGLTPYEQIRMTGGSESLATPAAFPCEPLLFLPTVNCGAQQRRRASGPDQFVEVFVLR